MIIVKNIDDGGPAFPSHGSMGEVIHEGMSLRDFFAAAAVAGMAKPWKSSDTMDDVREKAESIALAAYDIADAMIEERRMERD